MSVEKNVPQIRFNGFSGEWNLLSLGDLGTVATNKRIFIHQTSPVGDVPFYKIGTFGKEPKLFISQELFEEYKKRFPFPEKGDLLFSVIGSIGRVVEYTGEDEYFQDSNIVWLQHNGAIVNKFLKQFYSFVEWSGLEGSTIKHLYNRNILETKIQIPSQEEQTEIGNYFQTLDNLINQHQQKHDKLSSIKKAMLEKMFPKQGETVPEVRFKGFSGEWEVMTLGDYTTYRRGSFPQPYGNKEWYGGEGSMPFVQVVDVSKDLSLVEDTKQKISLKAQPRSVFVLKGSVVVTLQGTIGRVAITQYDSFVDRTILIFESFSRKTDSSFWAYTIQNKFDLEKRSAPGGTIKTITKEALSSFDVLIPSTEEQTKIGSHFQKLDTLINQHQQQITKLNNIKQACLSKMFV